ncbi:UPF0430 protein CG31712 [Eumeta japonica]|uniref:UPF0430 protein CG31712 n=1 Tax=Eumeta variegata TaxID=151549 RepID=A0A4C1ZNI2_EUMVA|nr:UPF0430 protein CG31712 [Eumeta japonica]
MGRSRSRSKSPRRHHKNSKHSRKKSRSKDRSSSRSRNSKHAEKSKERSSKSRKRSHSVSSSSSSEASYDGSRRKKSRGRSKMDEVDRLAEMERQRRLREAEQKVVEEEAAKRIELLVKKRVEEELEKRKDEIEQEVAKRVEEAKRKMEKEMMEELERQREEQRREELARQEEEARKRKELEEIMAENNKKIEEAQRKLAEERLAMIEEQRKMDEEMQKLKREQEKRLKEEQKRILDSEDGSKHLKMMKKPKNELLEDASYCWFLQKRSAGQPISGPLLCEKALQLNKKLGANESFVALGIGIIAGSVLVKVPQILKLLASKSAEGLNLYGVLLELFAITANFAYSYVMKFPFSAWGDATFLGIQTAIIGALILHYGGAAGRAVIFLAIYFAMVAVLVSDYTPLDVLWCLQAANVPVVLFAKASLSAEGCFPSSSFSVGRCTRTDALRRKCSGLYRLGCFPLHRAADGRPRSLNVSPAGAQPFEHEAEFKARNTFLGIRHGAHHTRSRLVEHLLGL